MFFNRIPFFGKKKPRERATKQTSVAHDQQLAGHVSQRKIPSWKQLRYISRYFSKKESAIFRFCGFLIIIISAVLLTRLYLHLTVEQAKPGGEYVEGLIGKPQFINPILAFSDTDLDISSLLFSGLLRYDENQALVPDLAERYEVSEDQKIYTIYLKHDVKWQDGQDLLADDVLFTIQTIQDPQFNSPLRKNFQGIQLEQVDEYTIKFTLEQPLAPFLSSLTMGILPKHIWQEIPSDRAQLTELNLKPIRSGSGPYQFESLTKDKNGDIKSYVVKRFEEHHGPKPFIEKITFKFYPDLPQTLEAAKNANIEGISFLPNESKKELSKFNKKLDFYSLRLPQYTAIFFNQKNDVLKQKQVREALAYSIDRERILSEALGNEGEIIHGPILPGYVGYNPEIKKFGFDLEKAGQILNDAGWQLVELQPETPAAAETPATTETPAATSEGTTPTESGEQLAAPSPTDAAVSAGEAAATTPAASQTPVKIRRKDNQDLAFSITTVDLPENRAALQIIQENWTALGVKLDVVIVDSATIKKETIKKRSYDALLFGEIVGSDPDPYPFWHSSQTEDPGLNLAIFYNKTVDQLLEEARQTNDVEQRRIKYLHFQNILVEEELPAIFLYNPTYIYGISRKVKGLESAYITTPSDRLAGIRDWYIKTKRVKKNKE